MWKYLWTLVPLLLLSASVAVLAQEAEDGEGDTAPEAKEEKDEKVEEEAPEKAEVGKKAPGFTLKNADGDDVSLSDFEDKIVVLEWINLDCPWVKAHYERADKLVKLQKELRDDGVVWLQICSSGDGQQGNFDEETLERRLERVSLVSKHYLKDADGKIGKKYDARVTPHCYVIDKEGKLQYAGALDNLRERRGKEDVKEVHYVKDAVKALQDDKEVATAETRPYG